MYKTYHIKLKTGLMLCNLTTSLTIGYLSDDQGENVYYNQALAKYGLYSINILEFTVIDEQLFGLFLLEFSDQIIVKAIK